MRNLTQQAASRQSTARTEGVLVTNVFPTGPADQAGIRPGDIYLALDGVPVRQGADIRAKNQATLIGQAYTVTLERDGKVQNISVRVAEVTVEYQAWRASQRTATP
jgi:serine protease Do